MFKNIIRQVPIHEILIDRENRQRSEITYDSILSLAVSIGRSQWITPILVDEDTNYLIAGERRLTAVKALYNAVNGNYEGFTNPDAARTELFTVCTCKVDSWNNWSKIPAQVGSNFTPNELVMYEFIENAQRQDLSWQDRAKAIYNIHLKGLSQNNLWNAGHTATLIGITPASVTENLRVWRVFSDPDATTEIKTIINDSTTLRSAAQTLERYTSRRESGPIVSLASGGVGIVKPKAEKSIYTKPGLAPGTNVYDTPLTDTIIYKEEEETSLLSARLIHNDDFISWARAYEGEQFNFIHCDFPYGIKFTDGKYTTRPASTVLCDYDDSENTYWNLLNALKENAHIIAPSSHIMFWFSQNLRRETEDFFTGMGGFVQPFLMIWHCGTNEGIVPDSQRYGRRTYETAMLITFGDRKIVTPRALSIEAGREISTRIHRSQKPLSVLRHFFEMFVDDSSVVLDPTAGSGTSLIVANDLGAKQVTGLEIDENIYKDACDHIDNISKVRL